MKKIRVLKEGDLIKIPFKEGAHTYGRILVEGSCAVYDCYSTTERKDYETITTCEILFITHVFASTVNEGSWTRITNIPLDESLKKYYPRYFNPTPQNQEIINFYGIYKAEIEEAIKKDWIKTGRIQLDGVPKHFHVETRISDYYAGKRHEGNKAIIWMFKKYLGLTSLDYDDFY
jgi:hypothetical protein